VIEAGPDAIEKRLKELKEEDTGHRTLLIEELEHVLRNHKARTHLSKSGSKPSPHSVSKSAADLISSSDVPGDTDSREESGDESEEDVAQNLRRCLLS
jgi:hypothetical protein